MSEISEEMRMTVVESREWYMAAYAPEGVPTSDHLKLRTVKISLALDSIPDQHVVLETLFISLDPYLRSRMTGREDGLYSPQYNLNEVVSAFGVGRVVRSKALIRKIDADAGILLPEYISTLGVPGFAAWIGIQVVAEPIKPGSNVFISAAAGAVGMYAGQLAKLKGCRVVGSTGSDEKVRLIKEEFGYDDAFNYHTETDYDAALSKYFPNGIDVYLDNVGGEMLEAVLNHVNRHAKIPLCGMISEYNKVWTERKGVRNLLNLVGKEVKMQGFLLGSYLDRFGDFAKEMESHLKERKINSKLKIVHGIDKFLESLGSLFTSSNIGKVVIQVK
ncbi:PREDICTED: NADP-dependent alkenal double bond reductase P1-like isoform X2 [Fragaria vesca subsp. vesca]|uniref:NADP-dependent alkenal double bond reductase P1-like isoform X2 n=1 Tax=Fragaria vesca subsp. vesca TaxID=101020 RepID=UPI0002C30483|nr:PREDICTED: NADP-dependent alkenal double bond reductase P1-like isoform X2 [Fragaria vesca subsp. vesca]